MVELLLHPDQFWLRTFWPVTIAAVCLWLASKAMSNAKQVHWLWRAGVIKLVVVAVIPFSIAVRLLPYFSGFQGVDSLPVTRSVGEGSRNANETERVATKPSIQADSEITESLTDISHSVPFQQTMTISSVAEIVWSIGFAIGMGILLLQYLAIRRRLHSLKPVTDARVTSVAYETGLALRLRRLPSVVLDPAAVSPEVVGLFRPTVVFPIWLVDRADETDLRLIFAHEFAHVKRRDLVWNFVAAVTTTAMFFHPAAWFIRRRLVIAQEFAADALALQTAGVNVCRYAELILRIVEATGHHRPRQSSVLISGLTYTELKERIEMMHSKRRTNGLWLSLACILLIAGLAPWTPAFIQAATADETSNKSPAAESPKSAAKSTNSPATSEFPYIVKFEQGATRFANGDEITILEVRGTAETMVSGNLYWIKGAYKLASHDRAMLAAYTTAARSADGTSRSFNVQQTIVDKGQGTFTLYLPMSVEGWPHVSFYQADKGEGFGGNYFGTGDSVLKKWWGENKESSTTTKR